MLCEVPLTKEQQEFAAEHHGLVYKFLNDNHLPEDEFYDVVIFPYLKAVRDYCDNGMGKPSKSMFLMIFYYIVVRMPLAYLLSYLGFGLNGIWVAVLISHVVASAAASISGTISFKKRLTAE